MDLRAFDVPRYLSVLPLFHDLGAAELERMARGCRVRRFARGDEVFRVGQACNDSTSP